MALTSSCNHFMWDEFAAVSVRGSLPHGRPGCIVNTDSERVNARLFTKLVHRHIDRCLALSAAALVKRSASQAVNAANGGRPHAFNRSQFFNAITSKF
jgi:hypothetical protein